MAQQEAFIDNRQDNPGKDASKNIINLINAAAEARTAQTELQKQIMLKQIGDKMDIQKNIAQKQANVDWVSSLAGQQSGSSDTATGASVGSGTGTGGVANSETPNAVTSPMASVVSPAAPPQAPQSPTPMLTQAAQPKPNPVLNGITPTPINSGTVTAPQAPAAPQPPSTQYTNLGYTPVEPQQLLQTRRQAGQTINHSDVMYAGALNKVKQGTASDGEIDMVNKMNNQDGKTQPQIIPSTNLEIQPTPQMSKVQQGLRSLEKMQGLPEGALWINPSTGDAEINPITKSKIEAQNKYNIEAPDRYGKIAEQDLMHIFSMRSGALGVQDAKINQAMHVKQLFDQSYDPNTGTYNLKAPQFAEATQALAVLVSNSNQTSEGQRQEIKQRTLAGDFNGALTYALGVPKNATSQEIAKMYIASVDRQGLTAQAIKEKDISDIKNLDSFNQLRKVAPDRADNLYKANFGIDYRDFIKKPWEERIKTVTGEAPAEGTTDGGGNQVGSGGQPTIFNAKTGKTMTLSADGKKWE